MKTEKHSLENLEDAFGLTFNHFKFVYAYRLSANEDHRVVLDNTIELMQKTFLLNHKGMQDFKAYLATRELELLELHRELGIDPLKIKTLDSRVRLLKEYRKLN